MEKVTDTWRTVPQRPQSRGPGVAYLVHIYPTGPGMGTRYALGDKPIVIGRSEGCDIRIDDHSVSRRHVRVVLKDDSYSAEDLNSTNGTFVNDVPAAPAALTALDDGDYLRVGNCIYRYLTGGNVEADYHEEIYRLMIIDALTEIHNKRFLMEFLDRELARSVRHGRPLALMMMDIDHFKAINDEFGHLAGDGTLRELAACIKADIRKEDLFARYGGEEFALVLVETPHTGALELAERIRQHVADRPFKAEDQPYRVTISIGVASTLGDVFLTPEELVRQADEKLYQAKHQGRNQVVG
jgi:diguanylate cyclase (GGDEF)-like protein